MRLQKNSPRSFPKVSIVTAIYNNAATVANAIESVLGQSYPNIEYVVVDGMSNDGTDQVIGRYADRIAVSVREPDHGIYDALNKGLRLATGEVIGFLHADDYLADPSIIEQVAARFNDPGLDAVYGDLLYVQAEDPNRIVRFWDSGPYDVNKFRWGWMPPHPTVYLRRSCYDRFGVFREDFDIAADYELMLRLFVRNQIRVSYLDRIMVKMRVGGKSNASLANRLRANTEDRRAWLVNGIRPPMALRFTKPLRKLSQFWRKPVTG